MNDVNQADVEKQAKAEAQRQWTENELSKVMNASFGESNNKLAASFKKTVLIRDYETEVIEASCEVNLDRNLNGAQRMFISSVMQIQMEYAAYVNLLNKGMVTQKAFEDRKSQLAYDYASIKQKAELVSGKSMDEFIEGIPELKITQ